MKKRFLFFLLFGFKFCEAQLLTTNKESYCSGERILFSYFLLDSIGKPAINSGDKTVYFVLCDEKAIYDSVMVGTNSLIATGYLNIPISNTKRSYDVKAYCKSRDGQVFVQARKRIAVSEFQEPGKEEQIQMTYAKNSQNLLTIAESKDERLSNSKVFDFFLNGFSDSVWGVATISAIAIKSKGNTVKNEQLSEFIKHNNDFDYKNIEAGIPISGRVYNSKGKPITHANIGIVSSNGDLVNGVSDSSGRFYTDVLQYYDSTELVVHAFHPKEEQLIVELDPFPRYLNLEEINDTIPVIIKRDTTSNTATDTSAKWKMLKEITVKGRKVTKDRIGRNLYDPHFVTTLDMKKIPPGYLNVFDFIKGRVAGVQVGGEPGSESVSIRNSSIPPLFLVDGLMSSIEYVRMLNPNDIEFIDFLKGPEAAIFGSKGYGGAIAIYMKQPDFFLEQESKKGGKVKVKYPGFQKPIPYETVRQDHTNCDNKILYWNPSVLFIKGKAQVSVEIPEKEKYVLIISGVLSNGEKFKAIYEPLD